MERYTPTMFGIVVPASNEEITRLETLTGALPESYREFLSWMGNDCLFLNAEELAYSPEDLMELVYEDPEIDVPNGLIWIGVDKSGAGVEVFLRRKDGVVVRIEYYDGMTERDAVLENASLASFLLTSYVRKTLTPSHPFHLAAAFSGDGAQVQEFLLRVDTACGYFNIPYPIILPDFRFYGGDDFVIGLHQRPGASVVYIYIGTIERLRYEAWYDLVFDRWKLIKMPI